MSIKKNNYQCNIIFVLSNFMFLQGLLTISSVVLAERNWTHEFTHYETRYYYGSAQATRDACDEMKRNRSGSTLPCTTCSSTTTFSCFLGHYNTGEIGPAGVGVTVYEFVRFISNTACNPNRHTNVCEDSPKTPPMSCPEEGNPVNVATGNKSQTEIDYQAQGSHPLEFKRYYSSSSQYSLQLTNYSDHHAGSGWRYSYMRSVREDSSGTSLTLIRDNGQQFSFIDSGGNWVTDVDTVLSVEKLFDLSQIHSGWKVTDSNDVVENYDVDGKLATISKKGKTIILDYDISSTLGGDDNSTTLDKVTDHDGNVLTLQYTIFYSTPLLDSITDPDGGVFDYEYDNPHKNLISVTYPDETPLDDTDNPVKQYLYENFNLPSHLTGIIDENGNRYATWAYDDEGRAILSEHANSSEKFTFTYNTDGTTTVTDQLGASRTYTFTEQFGVLKIASVVGDQCTFCGGQDQAITYDANGFVASRTDFEGNVTTYINNTRGLETSRTEASGTPEARTIATEWHSTFRLPTKITEPGKETMFTYSSNGKLLSKVKREVP